jgi:DNA-binding winged helix-turn-helix (wHTH) protein
LRQVFARIVEHTVYVFDGFHLDVTRRKLSSSGGVVQPLNSRAMDALLMLVTHAGTVLDKRRLMQAVWPAAIVEDNNLNQCILSIRRALGETAGANRYVMTVPGRGYCFVCPVRTLTAESAAESVSAAANGSPSQGLRAHSKWLGIGGVGAAASTLSLLLWVGIRGDSSSSAGETVLRLREAPSALSGCLKQRPDLHLQIELSLVDSGAPPAKWAAHYEVGTEDVVMQQSRARPLPEPCRQILHRD